MLQLMQFQFLVAFGHWVTIFDKLIECFHDVMDQRTFTRPNSINLIDSGYFAVAKY